MASQEMLKKLLEEFDEKEAQAREEINIVNLRIEELEKRIGSSRQRLEKISMDRVKIGEMMQRYANGSFLKKGAAAFASHFGTASSQPAQQTPVTHQATPTTAALSSASSTSFAAIPSAPPKPQAPESLSPPSISQPMHSASSAASASPALSVVASQAPHAPQVAQSPPVNPFSMPEPEVASASQASPQTVAETPVASPPVQAPVPSVTASSAPLPTLGAAGLFSSMPQPSGMVPGDTQENPSLLQEPSSLPAASPSPFSTPIPQSSVPPLPAGGLSAASLMQSMPTGGTPVPVENRGPGKFDMMDLFAPLSGDEAPASPSVPANAASAVAEPEPNPPEQSFAQSNQFYSTAAQAPPSQPPAAALDLSSSTATQEHPSLNGTDDALQIQELEEENDDTVKSINDALRGLFR